MKFVYRSVFVLGITLLVPVIFKYLTAKSKEDDTAVYTVKMRSNMMKVLKVMTIICIPLGIMAAIAFISYFLSGDWENMCYTAVVILVSIADFFMWKYYQNNKIVVLDDKKINSCKIKLYYKNKKIFTLTRQFDNFENMESWLDNLKSEEIADIF